MTNILDATGLVTSTQQELVDYMTTQFRTIYGADVNLGQDTPDGQMMMIFIQMILDIENLLTQVYNNFDPDLALGRVLDQRVAINGIQRQAGTFTITNVTVVTAQSLVLNGLDDNSSTPFTAADNAGNRWELIASVNLPTPGTYVLAFQSAVPGAVLTVPNTITTITTVVLGVTSVNNPTTYTSLGLNEESDYDLKIRRQRSVSLSSQGYLSGLLAALLNITGVSSAIVYENVTGSTDADGIPGHSIWVIIAGDASPAEIASAIYTKRNAGCGMKGDQTFGVFQVDGTIFLTRWDNVVPETLFTFFTASSLNGTVPPNVGAIRTGLVTSFVPGVFAQVNVNVLASDVQALDANTLVTVAGFSTGKTQTLTLSGTAASGTFKLNYNGNQTATLNWNDSVGTIQSALQAVAGLSAALVTGSIASHSLVIDLTPLTTPVLGLVTVSNNSLATSGPVAITFTYGYGATTTLQPTVKNQQFTVAAENIVILPILLTPTSGAVTAAQTIQFSAFGGYGAYAYALHVNASSGTINATTGLYTAGATPGSDTIRVTDAQGNFTDVVVVVS